MCTERTVWGGTVKLEELLHQLEAIRPEGGSIRTIDPAARWKKIPSRLLGITILLVLEPEATWEAEEAEPDLPLYTVPEIEILARYRERPDMIRELHRIRQSWEGWLVDPKKENEERK